MSKIRSDNGLGVSLSEPMLTKITDVLMRSKENMM